MIIKEYCMMRKQQIKEEISKLELPPHLVIIQANDDEASKAYVKGKIKDIETVNAKVTHVLLDTSVEEKALLALIEQYNNDDSVDGILVQMPLPSHISEELVKNKVNPLKDVDGFHPMSKYVPCTPKGIMDYLKHENVVFEGKKALVIGRSNIVGRPMAKLLLDASCTVCVAHSKTKEEDLNQYLSDADIVVCAIGKKWFIKDQVLKKSCVLVDVGINRCDGKLYGDCAPNLDVYLQTPVPGGIGLLTRLSMLENLLICSKERKK